MSTRFYPRFARGNPQLRVFLPNFWMKLMRPTYPLPPNKVQFACSMQMSKYDVKNYLTQIYKIPVVDVHVWVHSGKTKKNVIGYVIKEDDVKMARVTMVSRQLISKHNSHPFNCWAHVINCFISRYFSQRIRHLNSRISMRTRNPRRKKKTNRKRWRKWRRILTGIRKVRAIDRIYHHGFQFNQPIYSVWIAELFWMKT